MDLDFSSLKELKERITPAFNTKIKEFKNNNYIITTDEIWTFLKTHKWQKASNLTLYDIIKDILNLTIEEIEEYRSDTCDKPN